MPVAGSFASPSFVIGTLPGYSAGAVTAGQNLLEFQAPCDCRVGAVQANAQITGSGGGNTVLDVLVDEVSVWSLVASKPTLAAVSSGNFTATTPTARSALKGQRISLRVASVSTTGHGRLSLSVALERARNTL